MEADIVSPTEHGTVHVPRAPKPRADAAPLHPGRRRRPGRIVGGATGAYAGAIEPKGLIVTRYALTPPDWPAGRKLSITVIADLHAGGPDMPLPHVRRMVDTANALQSDIVVLLGDFTAWYNVRDEAGRDPLWAAELARLNAPLGTWAILGNHDWWQTWKACAARSPACSIPMLENNAVLLGAAGSNSGSPGSAISSPTSSATAAFAALTICRGRSRKSRPTIRCCCWCTSRTFFPACRSAWR